jgi:hypothetical protein
MRVRVTWSGGYAGATGNAVTADEGPGTDRAGKLSQLVEDLASGTSEGSIGADLYDYTIEVTTDRGTRTFKVTDPGDPEHVENPGLAELLSMTRTEP